MSKLLIEIGARNYCFSLTFAQHCIYLEVTQLTFTFMAEQLRTRSRAKQKLPSVIIQADDEVLVRGKELNKVNDGIGLRVQQGQLSLLTRKIFNVLVYHAQQLRVPGKDAPEGVRNGNKFFWVPLSEVAADASYDSNDTDLFKKTIDDLQDVRVYHEDTTAWTSERLLASVKIYKADGLRSRSSSTVWLGYMFPPEVESMVLKPNQYTKLSLYYQAQFRRGPSLSLYEVCKRYLTNPTKVTGRQLWGWWYSVLTGNSEEGKTPEYKYFKRDVINPAITEINSTTDLFVELIEYRAGRRVSELQFKVLPAKQSSLPFSAMNPSTAVIDTKSLERMMALSISQQDAENILASNPLVDIEKALNIVEKRLKNKSAATLQSPIGYFKRALKESYSEPDVANHDSSSTRRLAPKVDGKQALEQIKAKYMMARAADALELHRQQNVDEQTVNINSFLESKEYQAMPAVAKKTVTKGQPSPYAESAFSMWLAKNTWTEPTPQELYEFAAAELLNNKKSA